MGKDYKVGYGKPPKHSQFAPGQSGNPKGRKKGAKGLKTDLSNELNAKQTIQINGRPVTARRQQLMVMTLATRAAAGDTKAAQIILALITQVLGTEDRGRDRSALSPQDQAILDHLLSDRSSAAAPVHDGDRQVEQPKKGGRDE